MVDQCKPRSMSRRAALRTIGLGTAVGLAGCSGGAGSGGDGGTGHTHEEPIQVGVLFLGPKGGDYWQKSQRVAVNQLTEEYDWLETNISYEVPVSEAPQYFSDYADQGYDLVVSGYFNYGDVSNQQSTEYSDMHFELCGGAQRSKVTENMGIFYTKFYEASYLAGMAAGLTTETNTLGYVSAFPQATALRRVNAFFVGAREVNPDVTMKVRMTGSWYDPGKATQAADSLIDEDADVIASGTDSDAAIRTASDADVWSVGMYLPEMRQAGGENYITGVLTKFEEAYRNAITQVHDNDWEPDHEWYGIERDYVALDEWGPNVPQDVINEVEPVYDEFKNGEMTGMDIWSGTKFEDEDESFVYNEMASYVEGIEGST